MNSTTKLLSIKQASKEFNFPLEKLYRLVDTNQAPVIRMRNLSGTVTNKINTETFAEWLDNLARNKKII